MDTDFGHQDFRPSIEGLRARLAATPLEEGARRPSAVTTLLNLLEQRDRQAAEHAFRVAELASALAMELRLPADSVARLRLAALLHDVGKLSVPEDILSKPGPLTDEEWQRIRFHPEYGYQLIVSSVHPEVSDTVRAHCERLDGGGYPNGKIADQIPTGAKVLLVADAYDAMTSPRPYRPALSPAEALETLADGVGVEFDRDVIVALQHIAAYRDWLAA